MGRLGIRLGRTGLEMKIKIGKGEGRRGSRELLFYLCRVSVWDDEKFVEKNSSDGYTTM